jgi:hypothetical protein
MTSTEAFEAWWRAQSRKGDPQRNPNLTKEAFKAGFVAGLNEALETVKQTFPELSK